MRGQRLQRSEVIPEPISKQREAQVPDAAVAAAIPHSHKP